MRTSSSRLRAGAALASTGLALVFALGTPALAEKPEGGANGSGRQVDTTPNDHPSGKDRSEEPGDKPQGKSSSDPDGDFNGGADKPGEQGGFDADRDGNNGCGNDDDFEDDNKGNCGGPERTKPAPEVKDDKEERCVKASEMGQTKGKGKGVECDDKDDDADGKDDDKDDDVKGRDLDGDKDDDTDTKNENKDTTSGGSVSGTTTENVVTGLTTAPGAVLGSDLQRNLPEQAAPNAVETRVLGVSIERAAPAAAGETAGTPTAVLGATFTRGAAALARTGFGLTTLALIAGLALVLFGFGLKRMGRRDTI